MGRDIIATRIKLAFGNFENIDWQKKLINNNIVALAISWRAQVKSYANLIGLAESSRCSV